MSMPPCTTQYARWAEAARDRSYQPRRHRARNRRLTALIGDFAAGTVGHLTTFVRAEHAGEMTMADVGETDFAVIVYREEDQWEADVLPSAVTADLDGFVQALRRQPSMGGTIGFAGVDDFFFVAVRVLGDEVAMFLSDLTAAADYPLARQVLEALDIPVPADAARARGGRGRRGSRARASGRRPGRRRHPRRGGHGHRTGAQPPGDRP